jgi:hypothetical protein
LVAERGAEHATMREVAQAAGVGKGTLYHRFGEREGLLLTLLGETGLGEAYTAGPPPLGPGDRRETDWSSGPVPHLRSEQPSGLVTPTAWVSDADQT